MNKISIVGAGRVGESTALMIACQDACNELWLLDIQEGLPQGVALDIQETGPILDFDTRLYGSHQMEDVKDSDLVIITAGVPRKTGMSRSDVLDINVNVIDSIVAAIAALAPNALILMVTNPVDALTYEAFMRSGFPRQRVFGQAGVLDSTRMESFLAMETGLSVKDINALVLGGHGDTMVPLLRYTTISGIPIEELLPADRISEVIERTRHGGAEILDLRKHSSAYDAPAAAIAQMVDSLAHNRKRILPTVALLQGEYGLEKIAMGVPCVLGGAGVERIIELQLTEEERCLFDTSAAAISRDIKALGFD